MDKKIRPPALILSKLSKRACLAIRPFCILVLSYYFVFDSTNENILNVTVVQHNPVRILELFSCVLFSSFGLTPQRPLQVVSPLIPGGTQEATLPLICTGAVQRMDPLTNLQVIKLVFIGYYSKAKYGLQRGFYFISGVTKGW